MSDMNFLKFDLASLFKAPKVTVEEDVVLTPVEYEYKEMPGEYKEVDTDFIIVTPDVEQEKSIHEKMYAISNPEYSTVNLNPLPSYNIGGSEKFHES
jgi:hypothetical protein